MTNNNPKERGSALITALFIMTLVAIAATAMSTRLQLDIYRTRLTITSDQSYLASQAVSFWAMSELSKDKPLFNKSTPTGQILEFPITFKHSYPNITVTGQLYDLQGRFNLNTIHDKKYLLLFLRLLPIIMPNTDESKQRTIAKATKQWILPWMPGRGNDDFSSYYSKQKPPFHPANYPMQSVSEFRLIQGVDSRLWEISQDYLTALPEITPININTASSNVLMSLGNGLTKEKIKQIMAARGDKGITKANVLQELIQKLNIKPEQVTIDSQYFLSLAIVEGEELHLRHYTILKRHKDKSNQWHVSIIADTLNTL